MEVADGGNYQEIDNPDYVAEPDDVADEGKSKSPLTLFKLTLRSQSIYVSLCEHEMISKP